MVNEVKSYLGQKSPRVLKPRFLSAGLTPPLYTGLSGFLTKTEQRLRTQQASPSILSIRIGRSTQCQRPPSTIQYSTYMEIMQQQQIRPSTVMTCQALFWDRTYSQHVTLARPELRLLGIFTGPGASFCSIQSTS